MATTMTYNEWMNKQKTAADATKAEAVAAADKGYADSLYQAGLQAQASKPTYGAGAEALASRGLWGSGYQKYLSDSTADAYRLAANTARGVRNTEITNANKVYDTTMQAVNEEGAAMQREAYSDFYDRIRYGGTLDANGNYVEAPETTDVQKAYDEGLLTKEYYDLLTQQMNTTWRYATKEGYLDENDLLYSMAEIDQALEKLDEDPMLSEELKQQTREMYDLMYKPLYNPSRYTSDPASIARMSEKDADGYVTINAAAGNRGKVAGSSERGTNVFGEKYGRQEQVRLKVLDQTKAEEEELARVVSVVNKYEVPVGQYFYFNDQIYLNAGDNKVYRVDKNSPNRMYGKILGDIARGMTDEEKQKYEEATGRSLAYGS